MWYSTDCVERMGKSSSLLSRALIKGACKEVDRKPRWCSSCDGDEFHRSDGITDGRDVPDISERIGTYGKCRVNE